MNRIEIHKLLRKIVEDILDELFIADADELIDKGDQKNGYGIRKFVAILGEIEIIIPKFRKDTSNPEFVLERYSSVDNALVAIIREIYTLGLSTRDISKLPKKLAVDSINSAQVDTINRQLQEDVDYLTNRDLSKSTYPYLYPDVTYISARENRKVSKHALVTAIAIK